MDSKKIGNTVICIHSITDFIRAKRTFRITFSIFLRQKIVNQFRKVQQ